MQKITPFLWFNENAEQAVEYYQSVFKDLKVSTVARYSDAGPGPKGSVMTIAFEVFGQKFTALNGGPHFKFNPSVSFVVNCENQEEVDYYWEKLSEGGQQVQCGWLTDKFGLSWQVVPTALVRILSDKDPEKVKRAMAAMMKMKKLDIETLENA